MATVSSDQLAMLQNLLAAVSALKDSVGVATKTSTKASGSKTKKTKEKDPNAPKRALNPKIALQNEERAAIYKEMQDSYFAANPSTLGMDPKEIRKMAKEGKLPPFPTYPQALKEHSRRMGEKDPEHAKKSQARRVALDALQAERKKEKGSKKTSEASSVVSGPSEAAEAVEETAENIATPSPPTPPAPAPAPPPAPVAEPAEKKTRGRPKKVAPASAPIEPQPEIIINSKSDDPEEFNMTLKMPDGKSYLLNSKNWLLDSQQEWAGIYDPKTKTVDTNAPEPE
jgi:hypothetical protein